MEGTSMFIERHKELVIARICSGSRFRRMALFLSLSLVFLQVGIRSASAGGGTCPIPFDWKHDCAKVLKLRDPSYFGISPQDASDHQLLDYVKKNRASVATLLLQVDYG